MPTKKNTNLIWIDLEMTGLDPDHDVILEIATVITDAQLKIIATAPVLVIHQTDKILSQMNEWVTKCHTKTGLIEKVKQSKTTEKEAEKELLAFLAHHVTAGKSPMCGNSIHLDRAFLRHYMPDLEKYFHYRNIDVSTLKELAKRWMPAAVTSFKKANKHEALADIYESIEELKHYRQTILNC